MSCCHLQAAIHTTSAMYLLLGLSNKYSPLELLLLTNVIVVVWFDHARNESSSLQIRWKKHRMLAHTNDLLFL